MPNDAPKASSAEMLTEAAGKLDSIVQMYRHIDPAEVSEHSEVADQIVKAASEITRATARLQPGTAAMPRLWAAKDLKAAAQPRWVAKHRLPRGAVSLLVGDEGIGKSLLWVWIIAAITTGKPLPEFGIPARDPAMVVIVITEDVWAFDVLPRLIVAGADSGMITVICTEQDGSGAPVFPRDLHLIYEMDVPPAVVVVDAWLDTVPAGLPVRDPQQARQALHPWKELATSTDAAVLLLTHTNRVGSPNPRDRYGATGELRKKARMTLFAQLDDEGNLVVGPEKANSAAAVPASTFTINPVQHFEPTEDHDGTVPLLAYSGESERTAREHILDNAEGTDEPGGNPAHAFVLDCLNQKTDKEANAAEVLKAGRAAGFGDQELKDARRRHRNPRIASRKANFGDGWVWAIVTPGQGGTNNQGGEDGSQDGVPPVPPPSPPSPPSDVPGALTQHTPGYTDRVRQIVERQRNGDAGNA